MKAQNANYQAHQAQVNQLQNPAKIESNATLHGHRSSQDRLSKAEKEQNTSFNNKRAPVGRDPLAGKESAPSSDGGYPITDSVFNGASAAYYAALFAYDAVKSMGTVQQAYNSQELDSFQELITAWNQFAHEDSELLKKQGQSYVYSGIASFGFGVVGSAGAMLWGVGNPKGLFEGFGGMENVEGNLNQYYHDNTDDSEFTVKQTTLSEEEISGGVRSNEEENAVVPQEGSSSANQSSQAETRGNRIEINAEENIQNSRAKGKTKEDIEEIDEDSKAKRKKGDSRAAYWRERLQKHTSNFQMVSQLINSFASTGQSVGQGVGQWTTAATKQNADSYDKTKQLTQQVFQTEDQGWSSAIQTLKEMTGTAANEINQLAAAEQRA